MCDYINFAEAKQREIVSSSRVPEDNDLWAQVHQLKSIIKDVRELHEQVTTDNAACGDPDCCGDYEEQEVCADCQCDYPCPTIQILDGER